jgi:hypothetical protein
LSLGTQEDLHQCDVCGYTQTPPALDLPVGPAGR